MSRSSADGDGRLSLAQEELRRFDEAFPATGVHNLPLVVELDGPLQVDVLGRVLDELVQRHPMLQATVALVEGEARLAVRAHTPSPLRVVVLGHLDARERDDALARLEVEVGSAPFDRRMGPLYRAVVACVHAERHLLFLTLDRFACDGWACRVLLDQLGAAYSAAAGGRSSPLTGVPTFAAFVDSERSRLASGTFDGQIAFWRTTLADPPLRIELPADWRRPAQASGPGRRISRRVPGNVVKAARGVAMEEGVTLFTVVLSVLHALLARHSGEADVVVGSLVAKRRPAGFEEVIGCFADAVPLRADLSGDPTLRDVLRRSRETCRAAYEAAEVPAAMVARDLDPPRDLGRAPLFQVVLDSVPFAAPRACWGDVDARIRLATARPTTDDLTVYLGDDGDDVEIAVLYRADLFTAARAEEWLEQFEALLAAAVTDPDARLSRLSLVTPASRRRLPNPGRGLRASGTPRVEVPVLEQASRTPDRLAVRDGDAALSYAELCARSERLASDLTACGIHPGHLVAIWGHRGAPLVEAVLGVLRAGAAFTVIDDTYPAARVARCLHTARPDGLVEIKAGRPLPSEVLEIVGAGARVRIPQAPAAPATGAPADLPSDRTAADRAYVAFTSGSTGQPRAIAATHSPLAHFLRWHIDRFAFDRDDRFSMLSGLGHDPLLRDMFTPLWIGASLWVPDAVMLSAPGRLAEWMASAGISIAHLTPALANLLALGAADSACRLRGLRYAFVGGDVLTRDIVAGLRAMAPSVTCVNFYGTTETPQAVAYAVVPDPSIDGDGAPPEAVPLGAGIDDVDLLVLNAADQLAGVGELGEICVRTPYLAEGYVGDPAATAARFVRNPLGPDPGDRMYRTGDRGCYRLDGTVEFAGRSDDQLNVRGFRVERVEVEAALRSHPDVGGAAVVAREAAKSGTALVGYLVPGRRARPSASDLRAWVQARLPEYMVPSRFVFVDSLPLTASGKVAYAALPAGVPLAETSTAPRTRTEAVLVRIWEDVLGVAPVGIDQGFLDLGGHSLLAIQAVVRMRAAFGVDAPLAWLFEARTVEGLAERIERAIRTDGTPPVSMPRPPRPAGPLPLSLGQEWLWTLDQLDPGTAAYNLSFAVRLRGTLDRPAFERATREIVWRHAVLRTSFPCRDGVPFQQVTPEGSLDLAFEAVDGRDAETRARALADSPFDLAAGPLLRVCLLGITPDEHVLVVVVHHIVADGWSLGIFRDELAVFYNAYIGQGSRPLPPLPLQYGDFAWDQRQRFAAGAFASSLEYWRRQLSDAQGFDLGRVRAETPVAPSAVGRECAAAVAADAAAAVRGLARETGTTVFMVLLAGLAITLARHSGAHDLVIGSPIANRTPGTEPLIGYFAGGVALRVRLSGDMTIGDLLIQVRATCIAAFEHAEIPFETVVASAQPQRDLRFEPLIRVTFTLQNFPRSASALHGLTVEPVEIHVGDFEPAFFFSVFVRELPDSLRIRLRYNADLFSHDAMAGILEDYQAVLATLSSDARQLVGRVLQPLEVTP